MSALLVGVSPRRRAQGLPERFFNDMLRSSRSLFGVKAQLAEFMRNCTCVGGTQVLREHIGAWTMKW